MSTSYDVKITKYFSINIEYPPENRLFFMANAPPILSLICKIITYFYRLNRTKISTIMKNKLLTALMLLTLIVVIASCSSQKYGCPGNPQASYKFRG
jgi:hypothetical protein